MATKRAASRSKPGKPSKQQAEKLVSIPTDVVLAPQAEAPRLPSGRDLSTRQKAAVRELSWADFDRAVQSLARSIQKSFAPEAVVGVAHGGVFVGGALSGALGCTFYPVRISRRSRDKASVPGKAAKGAGKVVRGAQPELAGEMPRELKGLRVLVVDDVAASGETLELATSLALEAGAREVETACLVARPEGFSPDYCALPTDALVVFPWDYDAVAANPGSDVDPDKAGA
ncbi:phosphoribosyltransferase family protein [Myxococcaceae bacterium GXIMD 01537]